MPKDRIVNQRLLNTLVCAALLLPAAGTLTAAYAREAVPTSALGAKINNPAATLSSGIDVRNMDTNIRPQDDFYRYANGAWLKNTPVPADKPRWGSFDELRETALGNLRTIVDEIVAEKDKDKVAGSETQKIGDLYASYVDEARRESLGLKPLQDDLAKIDALKNKTDLPSLIGYFQQLRIAAPFSVRVAQDAKDATQYAVWISQSGLGMPDREYYLNDTDAKTKEVRAKYVVLIEKTLTAAGDKNAAASAKEILALETELAKSQWSRVDNRNPVKTYNKFPLTQLTELVPGYDWKAQLRALELEDKISSVVVSQPSYLTGFGKVLEATPISTWKSYFKWHLVSHFSPYLGKSFVEDNFAFNGTALRGVPTNEDAWKRGVRLVEASLGEALGKRYVAKHFPPEHKARMEKLVANLVTAFGQSIDGLDWMSDATKKEAQTKLAAMKPKIGYTSKWRDYSAITIAKDDLIGNVKRVAMAEAKRNLARLGKPVDREEWGMTPQTVNAYYNSRLNEIVFPAAILQPPFFNANADDAVNYGGIVAVIGHEIGHGFDDSGSQSDAVGNLRNWWTMEDREKFSTRTKALITQYGGYSPIPGYFVNGALTLGENIGDNSGLAVAFKAYRLSLGGKPSSVINGFTGEQRVFLGWAQVWRGKARDDSTIVQLKTDPHSPSEVRGNATLKNQPGFYEAFSVKVGDKMYLPPTERVTIW
jgi:putative endopeptidase